MDDELQPTRVFIVLEVRIARDTLAKALPEFSWVAVAGSRSPDDAAVAEIASLRPDAVLVDWSTVRDTTLVARLAAAAPGVKVIAFGVVEEEAEVFACAASGVAGYIPCDASLDMLVRMIAAVVRGELVCSPRMAAIMFRRIASLGAAPAPHNGCNGGPPLTPRETEIADLLEQGLSNKEIARSLGIRVATVKNHVHHILERLQVRRRGEAAVANRQRNHVTAS
jgi:DNA-binding NarL/FixJ family response regulator